MYVQVYVYTWVVYTHAVDVLAVGLFTVGSFTDSVDSCMMYRVCASVRKVCKSVYVYIQECEHEQGRSRALCKRAVHTRTQTYYTLNQ